MRRGRSKRGASSHRNGRRRAGVRAPVRRARSAGRSARRKAGLCDKLESIRVRWPRPHDGSQTDGGVPWGERSKGGGARSRSPRDRARGAELCRQATRAGRRQVGDAAKVLRNSNAAQGGSRAQEAARSDERQRRRALMGGSAAPDSASELAEGGEGSACGFGRRRAGTERRIVSDQASAEGASHIAPHRGHGGQGQCTG